MIPWGPGKEECELAKLVALEKEWKTPCTPQSMLGTAGMPLEVCQVTFKHNPGEVLSETGDTAISIACVLLCG